MAGVDASVDQYKLPGKGGPVLLIDGLYALDSMSIWLNNLLFTLAEATNIWKKIYYSISFLWSVRGEKKV